MRPGKLLEPSAPIPLILLREAWSPPEGVPVYAARIIDGDSFQLLDGQKIRLLGLNAPKLKGTGARGMAQPGSQEAIEGLRRRIMDGYVTLAFEGKKRDAYGGWLAMVKTEDGALVNLEMLKEGLARADHDAEFTRKADFEGAEKEARQAGRGLWGAGPTSRPGP